MYIKLIINTGKPGRKPTKYINLGNRYMPFIWKYMNIDGCEFLYENELEKLRLISCGIKSYNKYK